MGIEPDEFALGQRVVSETEPNMGLGTVVGVSGRTFEVAFTAVEDTRVYAKRGSPISRVLFGAGDGVRDVQGNEFIVHAVDVDDGLAIYEVTDSGGCRQRVMETALDDRLVPNRPKEKLLSGRISADAWFSLRYRTLVAAARWHKSEVRGLVGARVGAIAHQLYVAAQTADRHAPRVLLADEVGLGKTIEAGLIMHRMLLAGRIRRVLVVVPEALLHQWLVEMLRKFCLRFALFDKERIEQFKDENPFQTEQLVLCGMEAVSEFRDAVMQGEWDLLVVDEAHHLDWREGQGDPRYEAVESLACQTPSVLLLTATPEQFGLVGHFGRLRLLDPSRFHDYTSFLAEHEDYAEIASLAARLLTVDEPDKGDAAQLKRYLGPDHDLDSPDLIGDLLDRHGTGRVLFRNTRDAVSGFPKRRIHAHPLPRPDVYRDIIGLPGLTPERSYGEGWAAHDPRVAWLVDTLFSLGRDKVLVICAHAGTAVALRGELVQRHALRASVFHEGMEIVERDRAAAYFADAERGAQTLICSEIGSEGRNFQFVHHLVLFDLPPDPDLLEQRIGRLDRIGQTETVQLHVPYFHEGPQSVLYQWYDLGLAALSQVCAAAGALYREYADELAIRLDTGVAVRPWLLGVAERREQLNETLASGRDRLLELNSHREDVSRRLVEAVDIADHDSDLRIFIQKFWDFYGISHEPGVSLTHVLRPGNHMRGDGFPEVTEDGLTVTFSRVHALAHEDHEFLTWEHPMVLNAMEMLLSADRGAAAFTVVKLPNVRPGNLMLEMLFVVHCPAAPALQLDRFLPPTAIRLLIDGDGRDRAAEIDHDLLMGRCMTAKRKIAKALIKSQEKRMGILLAAGEQLAGVRTRDLLASVADAIETDLSAERNRLCSLAAVNPNVRPEEIADLDRRREVLPALLAQARPRLDAVRMIVSA